MPPPSSGWPKCFGKTGNRVYSPEKQHILYQLWLEDIAESSEYDTGIDVEFGDEFLTLTTCEYHREDGRFVVVARRVREGEVIE